MGQALGFGTRIKGLRSYLAQKVQSKCANAPYSGPHVRNPSDLQSKLLKGGLCGGSIGGWYRGSGWGFWEFDPKPYKPYSVGC